MQKILFLDVDGTLVNYKGQVPESAAQAVRRARMRGHRIYICSRAKQWLRSIRSCGRSVLTE